MSIRKARLSILMKSSTNKNQEKQLRLLIGKFKQQITGYKIAFFVTCGLLVLCLLAFFLIVPVLTRKPPAVYIKTLRNGHYQLMVNNKPYIVRGVCYNPVPIGHGPEYDWWSDPYKPWEIDGKLMADMRVNTIRVYQPGQDPKAVKEVIRYLYEKHNIRTLLGHWLGFWTYPCPLYADPEFRAQIRKEVVDMVNEYKNEPGVLGWILGNENNYSCFGHVNPWSSDAVDKEPDPAKRNIMRQRIYYSFIQELTQEIHKLDKNHPVALGNGELRGLDIARECCPDVDMIASIIYRGKSFGNMFSSVRSTFDKPLLLSEIGADSYDAVAKKENQNHQVFFLEAQWRQIFDNVANAPGGAGNCLGGVIFEWTDEWWKHNQADPQSWYVHDETANWYNGSYYFDGKAQMNMNEEWFGIVGISSTVKEAGVDKRTPKKAFYVLRELWKNPKPVKK